MNPIENKRQVTRLMLLFMTTYLISYLTRVNYAAVVTEIADAEGILRSVASLALTGSAVTYGVGQLLSGWLGDRIQPRTLVFCGLLTTLLTNLLIPLCGAAYQMTAVWCVNGLAQAFMWPPLVRLMSTLFSQTDYKRACVVVSWGSSLGTILVYLASPLCIRLAGWRSVFFVSAAAAAAMAAVNARASCRLCLKSRLTWRPRARFLGRRCSPLSCSVSFCRGACATVSPPGFLHCSRMRSDSETKPLSFPAWCCRYSGWLHSSLPRLFTAGRCTMS